jgi:hypothetical protein
MSIVGDGVDAAATAMLKSMPVSGSMVPEIPLGKQAAHPPFMMPTQVQVMKARVRHRKQEEEEKRR